MANKSKVWIGLITVNSIEGNNDLGDSKGAVVNVLIWANGKKNFEELVKKKMQEFEFQVEEIEDVEPFDFSDSVEYKDNLKELAVQVKQDKSLRWGTFYTYK